MQPGLVITGLVVGFAVGIAGIGAGALLTPMLVLLFGIPLRVAIGTGIACMGATKVIGGIKNLHQETTNTQLIRFLCLGGIPGSIVGCSLSAFVIHSYVTKAESLLSHTLAGALIITSVLLYTKTFLAISQDDPGTRGAWMGARRKPFTVAVGFVAAAMMSLTSIGTGTLVVVALVLLYPLRAPAMVGSDVVYGAVVTVLAALMQAGLGNTDVLLGANILLGSLPGIYLGTAFCARLPEKILRPTLATLVLAAGLRMVWCRVPRTKSNSKMVLPWGHAQMVSQTL